MPVAAPPQFTPLIARRRPRITDWNPEDQEFWESTGARIARRNMICSVFTEHIGFAVWTMWSTLILFLGPQYGLTPDQKFTLVSIPAGVGAALRVPYSLAVARFGGRDWTIVSASLLLLPTITAAVLLRPGIGYGTLLMLVTVAGVGGGNFASSMSNINSFYPERLKGLALGINAAGGNLGVAVVQLLGLLVLATAGATHPRVLVGVLIPLIVVAALVCAVRMDNLATAHNEKRALREACAEPQTWVISLLYIGTFGSFIGFGFAFGQVLLVQFPEHFSHVVMVKGVARTMPDPVKAAYLTFLGPLVGSVARPLGGWLADRRSGAVITFWTFVGMIAAAVLVLQASHQKSLPLFLAGFICLFVASGLGNGSTYKMIPVLFRDRAAAAVAAGADPEQARAQARRRTGAVIGIAGAIGAAGGVAVNISFRQSFLKQHNGNGAYVAFALFYVLCAVITWAVYLRPHRAAAAPVAAVGRTATADLLGFGALAGAIDAAGVPVRVATITLLDAYGQEVVRTRSADDGSYAFGDLCAGRYLLVCGTAGVWEPVTTLVDVTPGATTGLPLRLREVVADDDPISEILGTVCAVGLPVASALVTILDDTGAVLARGWTDDAGRYRVGPTRGGPVTVTVAVQGRTPAARALHLPAGALVHDLDLDA
ncbi:MAG TPA: MFS transporter [Sporichthyaceae bacterium]|nr:MFS transporter [Sporichthyaceae bacterium]